MEDFYFAYDYDEKNNYASRICRHYDYEFEQYNAKTRKWQRNEDLGGILIGDDVYYTEITEEQALRLISAL